MGLFRKKDYCGRAFKSVVCDGNNVVIDGNKVIINGKLVSDLNNVEDKEIYLIFEGNVGDVSVDRCSTIEIKGNAKSIRTASGDVKVDGIVEGDLTTTSGDVECGNVFGGVKTTSGDVKCSVAHGNISTISGDIEK